MSDIILKNQGQPENPAAGIATPGNSLLKTDFIMEQPGCPVNMAANGEYALWHVPYVHVPGYVWQIGILHRKTAE